MPIDAFYLLFSGGRIGGAQSIDLDQARAMRKALPSVALFGGGVGNQIMEGKLGVGSCYPLCIEALPVLPSEHHEAAARVQYRALTMEKELSRRDDGKMEEIRVYLPPPAPTDLLGHSAADAGKKARREDGPADQMRMGMELIVPGTRLATWIKIKDADDLHIGCLVAALVMFARDPHIGGQSARGMGLVDLTYRMIDTITGEVIDDFMRVEDGRAALSPPAEEAKARYDEHVRTIYDAYIADNRAGLTRLLAAS